MTPIIPSITLDLLSSEVRASIQQFVHEYKDIVTTKQSSYQVFISSEGSVVYYTRYGLFIYQDLESPIATMVTVDPPLQPITPREHDKHHVLFYYDYYLDLCNGILPGLIVDSLEALEPVAMSVDIELVDSFTEEWDRQVVKPVLYQALGVELPS